MSPQRELAGVLDNPAAERYVEGWLRADIPKPTRPVLRPVTRAREGGLMGVPKLCADPSMARHALSAFWKDEPAVNKCAAQVLRHVLYGSGAFSTHA